MQKLNYKDSGVDIAEGNALVENLKGLVKSTFNANVLGGIGSFSGAYALPSVNDLICNFATPLFFLDYYATGKLDKTKALEVIKGITQGCLEAQCALIGGETAEMPGMYEKEDFDLAGFAVGIGEKEIIQRGSQAKVGDVLIALPSSGIHSNGYSLVRKILTQNNIDLESIFEGKPLIETLLTPTKIYVQTFKKLQDKINALAHITGGGLIENLPRCLPNNIDAMIEECKIQTPPIFNLLSKYTEESDKYRTFNMGVGMVLVCSQENADLVAKESGGYIFGELKEGNNKVIFV